MGRPAPTPSDHTLVLAYLVTRAMVSLAQVRLSCLAIVFGVSCLHFFVYFFFFLKQILMSVPWERTTVPQQQHVPTHLGPIIVIVQQDTREME